MHAGCRDRGHCIRELETLNCGEEGLFRVAAKTIHGWTDHALAHLKAGVFSSCDDTAGGVDAGSERRLPADLVSALALQDVGKVEIGSLDIDPYRLGIGFRGGNLAQFQNVPRVTQFEHLPGFHVFTPLRTRATVSAGFYFSTLGQFASARPV